MRDFVVVIALAASLSAAPAVAHQVGLSRGLYTQGTDGVELELVFARAEAARAVPGLDANGDGVLAAEEVDAAATRFAADIVGDVRVAVPAGPCPGSFRGASLTEEDGLAVRAHFACPPAARTRVEFALAGRLAPGHTHIAHVVTAEGEREFLASADRSSFSFGPGAASAEDPTRWAYLGIGVEHILLGFDHLVFLFGLVIVGGRLRSMIAVVTAFTVAHSVSLGLSVLGVLAPPAVIVEPLIALSIVYVGVENFFVKSVAGRWRITAPFGLVHGFGFAGALAHVGVPADDVPLSLFLFNLGVEAGQLAVLVVVLPLTMMLRKAKILTEGVTHGASLLVAVLGFAWLVQRVLGALGVLD